MHHHRQEYGHHKGKAQRIDLLGTLAVYNKGEHGYQQYAEYPESVQGKVVEYRYHKKADTFHDEYIILSHFTDFIGVQVEPLKKADPRILPASAYQPA